MTVDKVDMIDRPPHYTHSEIEPIDVIEDWKLGFHLGNALKYICRAMHKGTSQEDILKAIWYLQRFADVGYNKVMTPDQACAKGVPEKGRQDRGPLSSYRSHSLAERACTPMIGKHKHP